MEHDSKAGSSSARDEQHRRGFVTAEAKYQTYTQIVQHHVNPRLAGTEKTREMIEFGLITLRPMHHILYVIHVCTHRHRQQRRWRAAATTREIGSQPSTQPSLIHPPIHPSLSLLISLEEFSHGRFFSLSSLLSSSLLSSLLAAPRGLRLELAGVMFDRLVLAVVCCWCRAFVAAF